ncbi:hypothetical protein H4R34_001320 [Dimargaris verticillata]|uniref:Derlin n=1 Tax=Dimargaris verticillata TaxID=2761393 RepID=A0A9W8BBN3_9FUNG|nr:hypothetical protein H4R34_001320 [Dimargaris verticillata]
MSDSPIDQLRSWFGRLPLLTRVMFTATITFACLISFMKITAPWPLVWPLVLQRFQVWRLVTCYFAQPLILSTLFDMYMLVQYSSRLETDVYARRKGDYAFFICFIMASGWLLSYFQQFYMLFDVLLFAIVYLWSRHFPTQRVRFIFGIEFQGMFLPWALLALSFLQQNVLPLTEVFGILAAHIFHHLTQPSQSPRGPPLLSTPTFFHRMFSDNRDAFGAQRVATTASRAPPSHPWGTGRTLGN